MKNQNLQLIQRQGYTTKKRCIDLISFSWNVLAVSEKLLEQSTHKIKTLFSFANKMGIYNKNWSRQKIKIEWRYFYFLSWSVFLIDPYFVLKWEQSFNLVSILSK